MAKPKVEAEVTANISQFERALIQAGEKGKEFGSKIGEAGRDVEKAFLGKDIAKMLQIGGAVAAVGILADKFKDFFKESLADFGRMETATLKLGLALHNPEKAKQIKESAENVAGPGYATAEEIMASTQALGNARFQFASKDDRPGSMTGLTTGVEMRGHATGAAIPQGGDALQAALANLNVLNDKGLPAMSEAILKFSVKGGEGKTAAKMFEAIPELEPAINKRIKQSGSHQNPEEWMKANVKSMDALKDLIVDTARLYNDPKTGKTPIQAEGDTLEGTTKKLVAEFSEIKDEVGEKIAPAFKSFATALETNIPSIEKSLEAFFERCAHGYQCDRQA